MLQNLPHNLKTSIVNINEQIEFAKTIRKK